MCRILVSNDEPSIPDLPSSMARVQDLLLADNFAYVNLEAVVMQISSEVVTDSTHRRKRVVDFVDGTQFAS